MSVVAGRAPVATAARLELAARARALRDQGMLLREIQAELGISYSYTQALLSDPDGVKARARKERYAGTCRLCGDPTDGSNGVAAAPDICKRCAAQELHDTRYWTKDTIIARFKAFHAVTGRTPTAVESMCKLGAPSIAARLSTARLAEIESLRDDVRLPHTAVVFREFGSWGAAARAAGFTPSRGGQPTHRERRSAMRRFIVLEKNGVGFKPRATVEALSSTGAIQEVADGEGVFVAIPEQHWLERTVAPKTVFAVVEEPGA